MLLFPAFTCLNRRHVLHFLRHPGGEASAHFVCRDEDDAAFMDIQPVNPGHVLAIPTRHSVGLSDLPPENGAKVFAVTQRVANALKASDLKCEGVNLFLADGEAAMQEVFHLHMHVFPRYAGDGFGMHYAESYFTKPASAALEEAAEKLRKNLQRPRQGRQWKDACPFFPLFPRRHR